MANANVHGKYTARSLKNRILLVKNRNARIVPVKNRKARVVPVKPLTSIMTKHIVFAEEKKYLAEFALIQS